MLPSKALNYMTTQCITCILFTDLLVFHICTGDCDRLWSHNNVNSKLSRNKLYSRNSIFLLLIGHFHMKPVIWNKYIIKTYKWHTTIRNTQTTLICSKLSFLRKLNVRLKRLKINKNNNPSVIALNSTN